MADTTAPLTVLYLLDHADPGGGETSFLGFIAEALARPDALRPVVVARGGGPVTEALHSMGAAVEIVDYPLRLRRGLLPVPGLEAVGRIGGAIDRHRPHLIHANNFFGLVHGGRAARRRRLPTVWTCHGWWELDNAPKRWLARRLADRILCVSEAVRRHTEEALEGRATILCNPLGVTPFRNRGETVADRRALRAEVRAEMAVGEEATLLAVVGRFQPIKGHRFLLDAMPSLLERHPGLLVWFVGDAILDDPTDAAEKAELQRRVREAGWDERVRFLGRRDDARRLMRGLDALVVPSERESFCMAAVEGLEAGVPVVGPDGWGPAEIIDAPATGRRFRPGDAGDLAAQILAVLEEESGFDAQAGPRRVAERFSARAHLERTLECYRELLGS
jgi:glycosyltransferase involved in cell wall biosynthesis